MIKGIILDVDGVIVGERIGYNSPYPHPDVIARLKAIRESGITISLCTAKPYWAVEPIIEGAGLRNLHITEGGAVIIDPIDHVILKAHAIQADLAKQVIEMFVAAGVYVEAYAVDEYLLDQQQASALTKTHEHILQRAPRLVPSLAAAVGMTEICKIMPIADNEQDKARLQHLFKPFEDKLTLSWGIHPIALPHIFGIITVKDISKEQAAGEIVKYNGIAESELLGIGDSTSDWQFMQHCGHVGTVANGSPELKALVNSKGDHSYTGGSVDHNGVLDIFDYFGLYIADNF